MAGFQTAITIKDVLDRIKENKMLLPAFQREFVWSPDQIQNLFDSLMKDYPFSSMLFWKVKNQEDKKNYRFYPLLKNYRQFYKTFEDQINAENFNDFHTVLDGQQRLTSFYIGFRGSYAWKEYRKQWLDNETSLPTRELYLNLTSQDEEGKYIFRFYTKGESQEFSDIFEDSKKNHWYKVHCTESFNPITTTYKDMLTEKERQILYKLYTVLTKPLINFYEIEDRDHDEAVNIFIRINSGGTNLSYSDIMFSMVVAGWIKINAKEEFYNLIRDVGNLGFTINNDFILRVYLYLFHKDVKFNLTSFNNSFLQDMETKWESVRESIGELFQFLNNYGLDYFTLTSNLSTLPILYYIYHSNIYKDFSKKTGYKTQREEIKKWLLIMLVRRVFGGSIDTVLRQSRLAFTNNIEKMFFQDNITKFPIDKLKSEIKKVSDIGEDFIEELLHVQKDHAYAFSILALLYPNLDFKNGNFNKDHIHPISVCIAEELDYQISNSILNLQLLDANENKSKQDKKLEKWLKDKKMTSIEYKKFLKNQLIPDVDLSLNNFEEFIEERKKLLTESLMELLN